MTTVYCRCAAALPLAPPQGQFIARRRAPRIKKQYAEIGGKSPIGDWTRHQGERMVQKLEVRRSRQRAVRELE